MEPIVILSPGSDVDEYGNPVADWTDPTRTETHGLIAPKMGGEIGTEGTPVKGDAVVYLRGGASVSVSAGDRIAAREQTFEVVGDPLLWANGFGITGWEVPVVKVVGSDEVGS